MTLRARLVVALTGIALLAVAAADVATYVILSSNLDGRVDATMTATRRGFEYAVAHGVTISCDALPRRGAIGTTRHSPFPLRRPPGTSLATQFVQLRTPTGVVVNARRCPAIIGSQSYQPRVPPSSAYLKLLHAHSGSIFATVPSTRPGGPPFRIDITRLPDGRILVQGIATGDNARTLHELLIAELVVGLIAMLLAAVIAWMVIGDELRPLDDVSRAAALIAGGDFDQRVEVDDKRGEIGQLAGAFNEMVEQIQVAFVARDHSERQLRQFVADASHELRTPMSAIAAYVELLDGRASADPEVLTRALTGIGDQTARMESLVTDLLVLARLDEGVRTVHHRVELVRLCARASESARHVDSGWPIELRASAPVEVDGDEGQLARVVANLLANVREHTARGTRTAVIVFEDAGAAVIEVHDDGNGMGPAATEHAFDRFFRADSSRTRTHGGAGLGLSIVRSVVDGHGGTVTLTSAVGAGTTVRVELPIAVSVAHSLADS